MNFDMFGTPPNGLVLKIIPAQGGVIINVFGKPDQAGDLYVIHDTDDMGQEIGKIITLHYLKKPNDQHNS
jgi:hypothetical protein